VCARLHDLRHFMVTQWLSPILKGEERPYLVAVVAWLHDIGYAPVLQHTGLHQLDGARWLRSLEYERLARIVAHHSEAGFELTLLGGT
jgi:HD superfamily phosphodiesterase